MLLVCEITENCTNFYYMCIINYSRNEPICYAIVFRYLHVYIYAFVICEVVFIYMYHTVKSLAVKRFGEQVLYEVWQNKV